jgi:hypothetical protein
VSRKLPTIPEPYENLPSLRVATMALKEGVEMLSGQRGDADDCAVTWGDLIRLGLIKQDQVPKDVGSNHP